MNFEMECDEKGGPVLRRVSTLERTPLRVLELHKRLTSVPSFLDSMGKESGLATLFNEENGLVLVDNVGAILLDVIIRGEIARIHPTFWDGRLRGREALCRQVCNEFMKEYDLVSVFTEVKHDRPTLIAFAKRIGFVITQQGAEGVLLQYLPPVYFHRENSGRS